MRRFALVGLLLLAGCTAGVPGSSPVNTSPTATPPETPTPVPPETPTRTPDPLESPKGTTTSTPTRATATSTGSSAGFGGETIEYVLRAGAIPEEFASVEATFRVVVVGDPDDLGPCYPGVFSKPYEPTLTPLATPRGECHRSDPVTVDLAALSDERPLGNYTAPDGTSGHALLLTGLAVERGNGTSVETIENVGGVELVSSSKMPRGAVGVEVGIETPHGDRDDDYWLRWEGFDPSDS